MISKYRLYFSSPGKTANDVILRADHRPIQTIAGILNGVDEVMEYAMRLIDQSKQP
jgi:hypothetical protein